MIAQTTAWARAARREAAAAIARIYDQGIADRVATFETESRTPAGVERVRGNRLRLQPQGVYGVH